MILDRSLEVVSSSSNFEDLRLSLKGLEVQSEMGRWKSAMIEKETEGFRRVLAMERLSEGWALEFGEHMQMDMVLVLHSWSGGRFWIQTNISGKQQEAMKKQPGFSSILWVRIWRWWSSYLKTLPWMNVNEILVEKEVSGWDAFLLKFSLMVRKKLVNYLESMRVEKPYSY